MKQKKESVIDKLNRKHNINIESSNESKQLLKKPEKIKKFEQPKFYESKPNLKHQIDTLRLPSDHGYNHAVVLTDMATRLTDAQPVKTTKSKQVLDATRKIYKRKILNKPHEIISDLGVEFKGDFQKSFNSENVKTTKKPKGRHLGIVDRKIQQISEGIQYLQHQDELKTGKTSKKWINALRSVVDSVNESTNENFKIKTSPDIIPEPRIKDGQNLFMVGDKVRTILFYPQDNITEKALHGKFRTGDNRWSKKIHTITNILIQPNRPLMYIIDNDNKNPYHHKQLQLFKKIN